MTAAKAPTKPNVLTSRQNVDKGDDEGSCSASGFEAAVSWVVMVPESSGAPSARR
ncbi:hypothetical protein GCM10009763_21200 [Dermacoccus profundi]|uniref:Uncharacterized protein n=2 Tax=Dermacoccus TaxID=57495 RepID=A0ABN2AXQ9_9MICO